MIPSAQLLRRAFVTTAVAWALLLPLATRLASEAQPSNGGYLFALFVYVVGGLVCHQLPARSFQLWAHQMPVCARCTGIYLGAAVAAIVALPWTRLAIRRSRAVLIAAALPTVLTLVYEWTTGEMPANGIRFAAGVPIGLVVASLVVTAADNQVN